MPLECPDFSLSISSFYLREFWIRKNNVSSLLELNRSLNRKRAAMAAVSCLLVLGALAIILISSPGWETVKKTFFDIEYGKEVFPTVIRGLWINLQLTKIGRAHV